MANLETTFKLRLLNEIAAYKIILRDIKRGRSNAALDLKRENYVQGRLDALLWTEMVFDGLQEQ